MKRYYKKLNSSCLGKHDTREIEVAELLELIYNSHLIENLEFAENLSDEEFARRLDLEVLKFVKKLYNDRFLQVGDYEVIYKEKAELIALEYSYMSFLDDSEFSEFKKEMKYEGFELSENTNKKLVYKNTGGDIIEIDCEVIEEGIAFNDVRLYEVKK